MGAGGRKRQAIFPSEGLTGGDTAVCPTGLKAAGAGGQPQDAERLEATVKVGSLDIDKYLFADSVGIPPVPKANFTFHPVLGRGGRRFGRRRRLGGWRRWRLSGWGRRGWRIGGCGFGRGCRLGRRLFGWGQGSIGGWWGWRRVGWCRHNNGDGLLNCRGRRKCRQWGARWLETYLVF